MKDVNILKNRGVNLEASLEYLGDMDLYDETLTEFLDLVDGKVADLTRFKDTHDMANYAISAHSLKSDARYLGFTTLGEIALSHEMAGKENREDFVVQNFDAFATWCAGMMVGSANVDNPEFADKINAFKFNLAKEYLPMIDFEEIREIFKKSSIEGVERGLQPKGKDSEEDEDLAGL